MRTGEPQPPRKIEDCYSETYQPRTVKQLPNQSFKNLSEGRDFKVRKSKKNKKKVGLGVYDAHRHYSDPRKSNLPQIVPRAPANRKKIFMPSSEPEQQAEEPKQQEQVLEKVRKHWLVFRPYEDDISIRPYPPPDRGYYFQLASCDIKIIRFTLEDNGFKDVKETKSTDWSLYWQTSPIKRAVYEGLTRYQKVNHFPFSYYITRKDLMYRAVSRMKEIHGAKHFGFVPKTYILPQEYLYLEDELRANPAKMWIIKPHASS